MIRRWLMRALALTLPSFCVLAWLVSYFQMYSLDRRGPTRDFTISLECGLIHYSQLDNPLLHVSQWRWSRLPADRAYVQRWYTGAACHGAGFAYDTFVPPFRGCLLAVPLWVPTLLAALALGLVWRKTRPPHRGRGFPVEPAHRHAV